MSDCNVCNFLRCTYSMRVLARIITRCLRSGIQTFFWATPGRSYSKMDSRPTGFNMTSVGCTGTLDFTVERGMRWVAPTVSYLWPTTVEPSRKVSENRNTQAATFLWFAPECTRVEPSRKVSENRKFTSKISVICAGMCQPWSRQGQLRKFALSTA